MAYCLINCSKTGGFLPGICSPGILISVHRILSNHENVKCLLITVSKSWDIGMIIYKISKVYMISVAENLFFFLSVKKGFFSSSKQGIHLHWYFQLADCS